MASGMLQHITVKLVLYVSLAALLFLALGLAYKSCQHKEAENALSVCRAETQGLHQEKGVLTVQLAQMRSSISDQNDAIEKWRAEVAKQEARAVEAEAKAGQVRVETQIKYRYIEKAPVPSNCEEALDWAVEELSRR